MAVYMKTNLLNTHGTGRRRPGSSNACVMSEKLAARPTKGLDEIVGASVIQQGVASRSLRKRVTQQLEFGFPRELVQGLSPRFCFPIEGVGTLF